MQAKKASDPAMRRLRGWKALARMGGSCKCSDLIGMLKLQLHHNAALNLHSVTSRIFIPNFFASRLTSSAPISRTTFFTYRPNFLSRRLGKNIIRLPATRKALLNNQTLITLFPHTANKPCRTTSASRRPGAAAPPATSSATWHR